MHRLAHGLLVLFLASACSDETSAPPSTPIPVEPVQGATEPAATSAAGDEIDAALLAVLQEKVREHRAEMARIAGQPNLTAEELSAYAASIGRPLPAAIDPAEIPRMQQMIGRMLTRSPTVEQMVPLAVRTQGQRALLVYRQDTAPPGELIMGSTIFEREGSDWRLLRSFTSNSELSAGTSAEDAARARLDEPDFREFYSARELPPLALEAGSLASDLELGTPLERPERCSVSLNGAQVIQDATSAETRLLLGRAFGQGRPIAQSPLAPHFSLLPGTNQVVLICPAPRTEPVQLKITRRGESLPSLVMLLDPAAGSDVQGSFEIAEPAREAPAAPTFLTNAATESSGIVLVRQTRGVASNASVDGEGGDNASSTGGPIDLMLRGLADGTHRGTVALRGLRPDTDTQTQIVVVAPGISRVWRLPIAGQASEEISFEIEVSDSGRSGAPLAPPSGFNMAADDVPTPDNPSGGGRVRRSSMITPHRAPDYQPPPG